MWHREKDLTPEVRATLDALGKLSIAQRRALVLTQLASVSMPQMAREVGLPLERAERELQAGAAALALALDVETLALRPVFEQLAASVEGRGRWPRATIVRRSGAARRRAHTAVGVLGAVAVLVVSGSLVTDSDGVRPSLDEAANRVPLNAAGRPQGRSSPCLVTLPESTLLGPDELSASYPGRRWTQVRTGDNSAGNGMALPCQQERYADPRGKATLVRRPRGRRPGRHGHRDPADRGLGQLPGPSRRAFRTTATWFAGCAETRVQLLGTRTPDPVGDESVQFVLRRWQAPVTTYVVGVARTGDYTTTTAVRFPGAATPDREAAAALLAGAVSRLCALPEAGACADPEPEVVDRDPLPTGQRPALLSEVDLPPVTGVDRPWVGTEPARPTANAAATGCDQTAFTGAFDGARFSRGVDPHVPGARGRPPAGVRSHRDRRRAAPAPGRRPWSTRCANGSAAAPERDLNTEVEELAREDARGYSLTAWRLDVKVTDQRSVVFFMAFLRTRTGVAQLGFVPAGGADLPDGAFLALAERARARLAQLPAPG